MLRLKRLCLVPLSVLLFISCATNEKIREVSQEQALLRLKVFPSREDVTNHTGKTRLETFTGANLKEARTEDLAFAIKSQHIKADESGLKFTETTISKVGEGLLSSYGQPELNQSFDRTYKATGEIVSTADFEADSYFNVSPFAFPEGEVGPNSKWVVEKKWTSEKVPYTLQAHYELLGYRPCLKDDRCALIEANATLQSGVQRKGEKMKSSHRGHILFAEGAGAMIASVYISDEEVTLKNLRTRVRTCVAAQASKLGTLKVPSAPVFGPCDLKGSLPTLTQSPPK